MRVKRGGPKRRMRHIVLLTPTRDRPASFKLCERWMRRQTMRDGVEWIVVDDGDQPIAPTMGQIYLRREPSAAGCTLPANLLAGLEVAEAMAPDALLFIEDDDWYAPNYVEQMERELCEGRIAGEMRRRFYHLPSRGYMTCYNRKHAALASTGIRGDMIRAAMRACRCAAGAQSPYVDLFLWGVGEKLAPRWQRLEWKRMGIGPNPFSNRRLSVGIKGAPGRGGLGAGHDSTPYPTFDLTGRILRSWVGAADAHALQALGRSCENRPPMEAGAEAGTGG